MTNEATDFGQLKPMIEQAAGNLKTAGVGEAVGVVTADSGYLSDDNLALDEELEVELMIATKSRRQAQTNSERPLGRIPKGLSRTQLMERASGPNGESFSIANEQRRSSRCSDNSDSAAWGPSDDAG